MSAAAQSEDRCLLLALSHDELGVIFDGLADPLQPVLAVLFSSTCKGLRTPPVLQSAQLTLTRRHCRAAKLWWRWSCRAVPAVAVVVSSRAGQGLRHFLKDGKDVRIMAGTARTG